RAHRGLAGGLDGGGVPAHDALTPGDRVALVDEQLEALAVQLHRVDAAVGEDAVSTAVDDDERVRVQRDDDTVHGGDGRGGLPYGIDRGTRADHGPGEDGIGHSCQSDGPS